MTVGVTRKRRTSPRRHVHRLGQGGTSGFQREHAQDLVRFARISHRLRVRGHRQAGDRHEIRRIMIDRQREPIVSREIGRLLAVQAAKEVSVKPSLT